MIDYRADEWGFHVAFGWIGSIAQRALVMAIPNAVLTFILATLLQQSDDDRFNNDDTSDAAEMAVSSFTAAMAFILYNRSNTAYDRTHHMSFVLSRL
jgi:ABC-type Co2+ transport system permease subunit